MERRGRKRKSGVTAVKESQPDPSGAVKEYNKLQAQEDALDREIADLERQGLDTNLKPHMEALHKYNEIKDATQVVLGYIAAAEQTTVLELHQQYDLPVD